jgi:phosphoribosylformylglycinamidine synthase
LGASEYYDQHGKIGQNVPEVDGAKNHKLYSFYGRAMRDRLIASAIAVNHGGLGVALAKTAIAGQMGLDITLPNSNLSVSQFLYSESNGRILVTVAPQNKKAFEKNFSGFDAVHHLGHVAYGNKLNIKNILSVDLKVLEESYKAPLRNY